MKVRFHGILKFTRHFLCSHPYRFDRVRPFFKVGNRQLATGKIRGELPTVLCLLPVFLKYPNICFLCGILI